MLTTTWIKRLGNHDEWYRPFCPINKAKQILNSSIIITHYLALLISSVPPNYLDNIFLRFLTTGDLTSYERPKRNCAPYQQPPKRKQWSTEPRQTIVFAMFGRDMKIVLLNEMEEEIGKCR
ncbi:hypothetical protein QQG55_22950 [Brugia pahangi]|uniref:Uncharacterized protein n=1 Tax=Brugia pahangi TaxID=6280 RepID=A0A0N4SWM4_BRUPA|nr:unnamed protein product [Brugia pahangi]